MWPFKKKKKKNQPNVKEDVTTTRAPIVLPGTPGLPTVAPPIPIEATEPHDSKKTEEVVKPIEPIDFESMTVVELKALAKDRGLQGYSTLKKAELIDLLK